MSKLLEKKKLNAQNSGNYYKLIHSYTWINLKTLNCYLMIFYGNMHELTLYLQIKP